jgi:hypothetical protein
MGSTAWISRSQEMLFRDLQTETKDFKYSQPRLFWKRDSFLFSTIHDEISGAHLITTQGEVVAFILFG